MFLPLLDAGRLQTKGVSSELHLPLLFLVLRHPPHQDEEYSPSTGCPNPVRDPLKIEWACIEATLGILEVSPKPSD